MATIQDIERMANDARESLWEQANSVGRDCKVYLHWSAGHYNTVFDDYHINIKGDGTIVVTGDLDELKSHTWRRNTGSVGISLCCAYNATSNNLGPEPPTQEQIEVMAQVIAAVCNGLWLTIDKAHVLTHGEAADNEDGVWCHDEYGPKSTCERWDLQYLGTDESPYFISDHEDPRTGGNVLRGKANFYRNKWKGDL